MIRRSISILIVGAIMLCGVAVYVKGTAPFERYLPEKVVQMLHSGMPAAFDGQGVKGDQAADYLDDSVDGLRARGPIAAMAGNRPVFVADVIDGYGTRVQADIPAEITMIRPISGCRLTPPLQGSVVGHVTSGATGLDLPMLTYDDTNLATAVQGLVDRYRESGDATVTVPDGLAYEVYDVAVTQTGTPVYLVLEANDRNRMWNIHLAPGATIERVVLLGGRHAGIANLDPVVPVEVLPDDSLASCGISPFYALNSGHGFFEVLKSGSATDKQVAETNMQVMQDQIVAYNTWFRDSFGVLADETRAGFLDATLSVVGPEPGDAEPKAVYKSIKGARIRMTQDVYFEIAGQVPAGEDFAGRVRAIATSFAFGDLTTLRPGVAF